MAANEGALIPIDSLVEAAIVGARPADPLQLIRGESTRVPERVT